MKKLRISRKFIAWTILLSVVALLVVVVCDEAWARAGGGNRYSGGSRSSSGGYSSSSRRSSGGSGGGGGGDIIFLLIHLIFRYPLVGIPLTIFLIYLGYKGYLKGEDSHMGFVMSRANDLRRRSPERTSRVSLDRIQQKDPDFSEQMFVARAKKAFNIIQQAWTDRNLDSAQAFLSDGIFEQFSIQLAEMKEKGIIDHMEGLKILSVFPVGLSCDQNFDAIHLKIEAEAINFRKNDKTNRFIEGSRLPERFSEVWTLLRKPGAKTSKKPGLLEGQCPNCGNPIKIGRLSKCDVCSALLRSGEYDWVLTRITQACEWSLPPEKAIPGLADIQKADPGFNIQHIKERASVMFWRKIEAERIGRLDPLRKIARDEFCEGQAQYLKPDNAGARRFYSSCAVGVVNLLGIDLQEPLDTAFLEVIWSGVPSMVYKDGKIEVAPSPINFKHIFVLGRRHGSQTKLESSLASAHCPACGAPEQTSSENACAYCGSVMNDGSKEWTLETVVDHGDEQVRAMIQKLRENTRNQEKDREVAANGPATTEVASGEFSVSGLELIRWAIAMMLADGQIDDKEMLMIKDLAARRSVDEAKIRQIIAEFQAVGDSFNHAAATSQIEPDADLVRHLARVALADGTVSQEETDLLARVGEKIGFSHVDLDMLIKRERRNLYQEAKELLRKSKI